MARIGILGSCVGRDALDELSATNHTIVIYSARCSMISIMAKPILVQISNLPDISNFETRCIREDLQKDFFERLAKANLDILVIDFIDERYDVCSNEESYFSWNPLHQKLPNVGRLYSNVRKIAKSSDEGRSLWVQSVSRFAAKLKSLAPNLSIILIDARFALQSCDGSGKISDFDSQIKNWSMSQNSMLSFMIKNFECVMSSAETISVPEEFTIADASHRWGPAPFHYVSIWYGFVGQRIIAALERLT